MEPTEFFAATRDLIGWNGEHILAGMRAPVEDWPVEYVQHLVAEGTLRIESGGTVAYLAPDAPDSLTTPVREPIVDRIVDVAGAAEQTQRGGDAG